MRRSTAAVARMPSRFSSASSFLHAPVDAHVRQGHAEPFGALVLKV
jgi:hypothetical protein